MIHTGSIGLEATRYPLREMTDPQNRSSKKISGPKRSRPLAQNVRFHKTDLEKNSEAEMLSKLLLLQNPWLLCLLVICVALTGYCIWKAFQCD
jgi:hypothetical protein